MLQGVPLCDPFLSLSIFCVLHQRTQLSCLFVVPLFVPVTGVLFFTTQDEEEWGPRGLKVSLRVSLETLDVLSQLCITAVWAAQLRHIRSRQAQKSYLIITS